MTEVIPTPDHIVVVAAPEAGSMADRVEAMKFLVAEAQELDLSYGDDYARIKFQRAMSKVPAVEPEECDRLT